MKALARLSVLFVVAAGSIFAKSPFAGTWQGKAEGLPAITLTVKDQGASPRGKITFYLLKRSAEKDPWHVDSKETTPLLKPKTDGKTLSFEVAHHKFHGSKEFGPNVPMQVTLISDRQAKLGDMVLTREK